MHRNFLNTTVIALLIGLIYLAMGFASASAAAQEITITVGEPTFLSSLIHQNQAALLISRTGVVGVIYPKPGVEPRYPDNATQAGATGYRISTDGGFTWSAEMESPAWFGGGQDSGTLFPGGPTGAIIPATDSWPSTNYTRAEGWKGDRNIDFENPAGGLIEGRYDTIFLRFTDDMLSWTSYETTELASYYVPTHITGQGHVHGPAAAKGKIIQMPDGESLLMPMHGTFEGDNPDLMRAYLVRSTDQGHTWNYYSTIAYEPVDPNPELPAVYEGSSEPSVVLLPNGRMLAMLRAQYYPIGDYRSLYTAWSDDLGLTWTTAIPADPYLYSISPTLQVLDNGIVAVEYGRPGFHVAFSTDYGLTWPDKVTFEDGSEPLITGQFDMIKTGPNTLVAVGTDAEGTKVWPITVEWLDGPPLPGDVNSDGFVSAPDIAYIITNWGESGVGRGGGDLDYNGVVGAGDYQQVLDNWGNRSSPPEPPEDTGATPEPSTLLLLTAGTILLAKSRRPRRQAH